MHQSVTSRAAWALAVVLAGALAGCAQVPTIPEEPAIQVPAQITLTGARGPLSQRRTDALLKRLAASAPDAGALERHLAIEQSLGGPPLFTGNQVTILRDGSEAFAATFAAIKTARHFIYLEYYTLEEIRQQDTSLSKLLLARRRAGVQVDVIYDTVGSLNTPGEFFERLEDGGIPVQAFNPINPFRAHFALNYRDHRKLLLVDDRLAILGGVNLSSVYLSGTLASGTWHDTDLEISGPAVREVKLLFEQHWREQGGDPAALAGDDPSGGDRDNTGALGAGAPGTDAPGDQVVRILGSQAGALSPRYYATLLSAVRGAGERIDVTAAYFAPTLQEQRALLRAVRRGVAVRLLLPSHSDSSPALAVQHSHYGALLKGGVQIYERLDGILHSKAIVMDAVWTIVGSSNFDHRSVLFNDEIDAVVIGSQTGAQMERYFEQDLLHAQRIDAGLWAQRPLSQRLRESFWRLWEQLL